MGDLMEKDQKNGNIEDDKDIQSEVDITDSKKINLNIGGKQIVINLSKVFDLDKIKNNKKIILCVVAISIITIIGSLYTFIPSSYIIEIEYPGQFHAGFGSENLNREGFTTNNIHVENLGDTSYINIGAKKDSSDSGTLTLIIKKKWLLYEGIVASNSTSSPYGEVELHYSS